MSNTHKDSKNESLEMEEAIAPLKLLELKFLFKIKANSCEKTEFFNEP